MFENIHKKIKENLSNDQEYKKLFRIDIKRLDSEIKALNYKLNKAALKRGTLKEKHSAACVGYTKTVKAYMMSYANKSRNLISKNIFCQWLGEDKRATS